MKIYVNDEPIECQDDITISILLEQLHQVRPGIAIALNKKILPREQWDYQHLHNGDLILLFQVIAGG